GGSPCRWKAWSTSTPNARAWTRSSSASSRSWRSRRASWPAKASSPTPRPPWSSRSARDWSTGRPGATPWPRSARGCSRATHAAGLAARRHRSRKLPLSPKGVVPMRLLLACALLLASLPASSADLVLHNGLVWTGDAARPSASALAIGDGRITAVGDDATMLALAGPGTQRIDLQGHRVVPGINDAHVHLGAMPASTGLEPPCPEPDPAQVLDALRAQPRDGEGWITGQVGGQAFADPRLDRRHLDAVQPTRPVMLASWTGHGTILNSA